MTMQTKRRQAQQTVASFMRALIADGKTNEETFKAARKKFGPKVVTDKKRWFPAWYRWQLKNRPLKTATAARASKPTAR